MGFFKRLVGSLFGKKPELEALLDEPVEARPPSLSPVGALEVESSDVERVATVPPPPPGAPPIDLRNGVDNTDFSSSILLGLEGALRELAREADHTEVAFINYLRKTIASRGIRLPTIPEAVVNIEAILRKPDCSVRAVAECVAADPAIATKLVGVANSPFYAAARRVTAIDAAIGRLGLRETKNVVQAVAFGSRMFRVPGWEKETERLYHHALVTAMAARALAEQVGLDPDELFMAGLIQDIGRVVVLSTVAEVEHTKRAPVSRELVTRVTDEVHADLSALVAESWNASMEAVVGARYHHRPSMVGQPAAQRFAYLLAAADGIAHALLQPAAAPDDNAARLYAESVEALQIAPYLDAILTQVRANAGAFGVHFPAAAAERRAG